MVQVKRKRQHMTWTRLQEEFQPLGPNKLVKRSDNPPDAPTAPYRKIGKHKLVLQPAKPVDPVKGPEAERTVLAKRPPPKAAKAPPYRPEYSKEMRTTGTSTSSAALPRKLGRNKLVFSNSTSSTTAPDAKVAATPMSSPPPPPRGRNYQLILSKPESKNESSTINKPGRAEESTRPPDAGSAAASAVAAANLKHLRANYKATKSGLKRVEPPVCKFFQQRGMCFDDNCPYRHVKVGRLGKMT
jgi:hypothetical protein